MLRNRTLNLLGASLLLAAFTSPAFSQAGAANASASAATSVSAEMTKGKLSSSSSKPGDQVMLKLKDDVKSDGQVVLKKGSTITGVVRNVKRADSKTESNANTQSVMEIEWLAPASQGKASEQLLVTVQSITHVNPGYRASQESDGGAGMLSAGAAGSGAARTSGGGSGGGLLGGSIGAMTGIAGGVTSTVGGAASSVTTSASSTTNLGMSGLGSAVAADSRTAATIQSTLGKSDGQLFQTGHGEVVSAGGTRQSLDIFSHMKNDTVLASPNKNLEISSGAQMQLLVGAKRN